MTTFSKYSRIAAVLSAVLFVAVGTGNPAHAQKTAAAAVPVFGSVDLQKCGQESKGRLASEDELRRFVQSLDGSLKRLAASSSRFLADTEIKELAALYEKDPASEADKKRITELETKGDASGGELTRLQQAASPSDTEKKRFNELTAQQQKGDETLQSINATYSSRLQVRRDELSAKYTAIIRDAVSKIAKEKGLTVVFDSQFALYTANDITADVIKSLNK